MIEHDEQEASVILNKGREIPIVTFYSIQGGVGKTTLARKFAELVTVADGLNGARPNVLVLDLDVESQGLTYRMTDGLFPGGVRTLHEILAQRNATAALPVDVTTSVSVGNPEPDSSSPLGRFYLMPAAPAGAKQIFDTIATIDRAELYSLLRELIQTLVVQHDISCVVVDCAPGANPYTAAAATLATIPLLVGRNEQTTYEQIRSLPERFKEWYPSFQSAKQRVVINAVANQKAYDVKRLKYGVLDYLPHVGDIILATEELFHGDSFRLILFNKYVADMMKRILVGDIHLAPNLPMVVGQEWIETIKKLERCEEAPRVRRLSKIRHLRWVGGLLFLASISLLVTKSYLEASPSTEMMQTIGIWGMIVGFAMGACGWYGASERHRLLADARQLVLEGAERAIKMVEEGTSHRRRLDAMRALADTIPPPAKTVTAH